jgi:hypothetical protein
MNSALEIYKDIAAGSAQINPFSDYFQETEENMKTMSPIFEGRGITRDVHVQMPFSCGDSDTRDNGCNARFDQGQEKMIRQMEAEDLPDPYGSDMYDYSKGVFFDYASADYKVVERFMTACDPLKENTDQCLKRIFECSPNEEWEDCRKYIDYCPGREPDRICKYNLNQELIKMYIVPTPTTKKNDIPITKRYATGVGTELPLQTPMIKKNDILTPGRDVTGVGTVFSKPLPI